MTDEEHAQLEYQAQFRRIVVRTVILIACATLLLGVGRLLRDWQPDRRAIPLVTGDILYYRGATFGTNHVAPGLPRMVQRLPSALYDPVVRYLRLAPGSGRHTTSEPRLVLWLDDTHPMVTNRAAAVPIQWMLGNQSGEVAGTKVRSTLAPGQPGLIRLEFDAFPRRSRILQLQAFTRVMAGVLRPAGHLIIPNRHRSAAPEWEPESVPLVRTNTGLECALLALSTGVGSNERWAFEEDASVTLTCNPADSGEETRTAAVFSFREPDGREGDWTVGRVELSDATGNHLASNSSSTSPGPGMVLFAFGPSLWPDDTWRVEVWAKRTRDAAFSADERFEFLAVPVPPEGDTELIQSVVRRGDLELRLEQLEHRPPLPNRSSYSSADLSQLSVTVSNLADGDYLDLIEVIDDQGRALTPAGWSRSQGNPTEARFSLRAIPAGARTLDIRFAVHPGRPFVFEVRPDRCPTNGWSMRFQPDLTTAVAAP